MSRTRFDITDDAFVAFLERTNASFEKGKLRHMFVGSVAVQVWLADYICAARKAPLLEVAESENVSAMFRKANDVDVAVNLKPEELGKLVPVYGHMANEYIESPRGNLVSIYKGDGLMKPDFQIAVDGVINPANVVRLELVRRVEDVLHQPNFNELEPKLYNEFLGRALTIDIPYCAGKNGCVRSVALTVMCPEDLIVTGLARNEDWDEAECVMLAKYSVLTQNPVEVPAVRKVLCSDKNRFGMQNSYLKGRYVAFENELFDKLSPDELKFLGLEKRLADKSAGSQ